MNDTAVGNALPAAAETSGAALVQELQGWIDNAQPDGYQQRTRDRFPICCTLQLILIDGGGKLLYNEVLDAVGKDLSTTGIAFSHVSPLPCQRAVISFSHPKVDSFAVEVEILWSKPTRAGLYESGCRLIRKLASHELRVKH